MLRTVLLSLATLIILLSTIWALMALWFQLPFAVLGKALVMGAWGIAVLLCLLLLWSGRPWAGIICYLLLFIALLSWWGRLEPTHDRDWADDLAHITTGVVDGDQVTLQNVRNFTWRDEDDYDARWETRQYDLSQLRSVDLITSQWGMPGIAHILVSFGFEDGRFITFTVEIRRERDQSFSAIGGFFKQFELNVIAADERDAVLVRTNVRGEDGHIYRVEMPESAMGELFIAYVEEGNKLQAEPRYYHTVTANCTIIVYNMMDRIIDGLPMDVRLLLSAYLPSYIEKEGGLVDQPLEDLKERGHFTERAKAAGDVADFSELIRLGVPGWEALQPGEASQRAVR